MAPPRPSLGLTAHSSHTSRPRAETPREVRRAEKRILDDRLNPIALGSYYAPSSWRICKGRAASVSASCHLSRNDLHISRDIYARATRCNLQWNVQAAITWLAWVRDVVAQTFEAAVSPTSQSAAHPVHQVCPSRLEVRRVWKPATQQTRRYSEVCATLNTSRCNAPCKVLPVNCYEAYYPARRSSPARQRHEMAEQTQ
jgi:hypothetical protein